MNQFKLTRKNNNIVTLLREVMTNVHVTRHITPYVGQTWKNERGEKNFLRQVVGVYRHSDNPFTIFDRIF